MKLEKWEIDLRKQLGNKLNKQDVDYSDESYDEYSFEEENLEENPQESDDQENWEDKLKEEIGVLPEPKKESDNFAFFVLVFLGIVLLIAFDLKTNLVSNYIGQIFYKNSIQKTEMTPEIKSSVVSVNSAANSAKALEALEKTNAELSSLKDKIKFNSDRINLVGVMLNENFNIIRNNHKKGELIMFNSDWTLDKMPSHLKISEKDKEFLEKFVKKN